MNWEHEAASRLPLLLERWLRTKVTVERSVVTGPGRPDLVIHTGGDRLIVVEVKGSDDVATLERAAAQVKHYTGHQKGIGVVAVPYMGPMARAWAEKAGVSWADLSGNADIRGEDLCIVVSGQKNRYASPGRPSNPFAPRFSRLSRALLKEADRWWKQADIALEVGLPSGTVSKVVQRLDALELLERNASDEIRARAPSVLLDSWVQRYRFDHHILRRYHIAARSGGEALAALAGVLTLHDVKFAATGLSAAWHYTAFADFRINTFLVDQHPRDPEALGLRPVERGENVWLLVPQDEGAFYGRVQQGIWCAHPVQVYLDLLSHPERATDAARELRSQWMSWRA